MDNGETSFNIYLDQSKAFDTLDHAIPLNKMKYYGIKNNDSYLSNRKQFVDIEGTKSEMLQIKTGVPQGLVLGPLLFF